MVLGNSEMFFLSAGTAFSVVSAYLRTGGILHTNLQTGILWASLHQRSACWVVGLGDRVLCLHAVLLAQATTAAITLVEIRSP